MRRGWLEAGCSPYRAPATVCVRRAERWYWQTVGGDSAISPPEPSANFRRAVALSLGSPRRLAGGLSQHSTRLTKMSSTNRAGLPSGADEGR